VTYSVTAPTTYTITLVVTDGGLSSQATRQVRVQPGATLTCGTVQCTLGLSERATVVVMLTSSSCQAHGNTFVITQPAVDTLFTDGCFAPVSPDPGSSFTLNNGAAYEAGTELAAEVLTGVAGSTQRRASSHRRLRQRLDPEVRRWVRRAGRAGFQRSDYPGQGQTSTVTAQPLIVRS
jgi:hypothetical protein